MEIIFLGEINTPTVNTIYMIGREKVNDGRSFIRFEMVENKVREAFFATDAERDNAFSEITLALNSNQNSVEIFTL
jgi:hypothetical protein